MEFKRTITPQELTVLSNNPQQELHGVVNSHITRRSNAQVSESAEGRILSLMTNIPQNTRSVFTSHNAIYSNNLISLGYCRFVITGLYVSNLITRVSRGNYVKKPDELEAVENEILCIEMSGKPSGHERERYEFLTKKRDALK